MNIKEFLERSNLAIKNKKKDETLLTHQNKFLRYRLLLRLIQQLSGLLSVFEFKNDIFFKENIPFIIINDLYSRLIIFFTLKNQVSLI